MTLCLMFYSQPSQPPFSINSFLWAFDLLMLNIKVEITTLITCSPNFIVFISNREDNINVQFNAGNCILFHVLYSHISFVAVSYIRFLLYTTFVWQCSYLYIILTHILSRVGRGRIKLKTLNWANITTKTLCRLQSQWYTSGNQLLQVIK